MVTASNAPPAEPMEAMLGRLSGQAEALYVVSVGLTTAEISEATREWLARWLARELTAALRDFRTVDDWLGGRLIDEEAGPGLVSLSSREPGRRKRGRVTVGADDAQEAPE